LNAVRETFPDFRIGFDANGSFTETDWETLQLIDSLKPDMLEQPFAPENLHLCRELKNRLPKMKICLDESITGMGDLISAHQLNALDEVNIKPGRIGGSLATLQMLSYCQEHQLPAWVGGMFETGIGRMANLRVAALLPNANAHDLSPSKRYFKTDIVLQPIDMSTSGFIDVSEDKPVEIDKAAIEKHLNQRISLSK